MKYIAIFYISTLLELIGGTAEYRIVNRQPHRLSPVRDQTPARSPCEAAACPVDDTYPT